MRTLITDVDGCLLDWRNAFNEWLVKHGYVKTHDEWNPYDYFPTVFKDRDEGNRLVRIFNETYMIGQLQPIAGARKALMAFHDEGYRIKVVTAFSNDLVAMRMREQNLTNAFGNIFASIDCLPLGASKKDYLQRQPKDSLYVEDFTKHIDEALDVGLTNLFLIHQPWNYSDFVNNKYTKYVRRMSWKRITDHL